MSYEIEFTSEAFLDLKSLRKSERQEVLAGIEANLNVIKLREVIQT